MGFVGVYRALYDYVPQAVGELAIEENDLLYILEKNSEDGWWKAKKKAGAEDEDEPVGLIPHNYVEEAQPLSYARALYEYTRQTDEELSFPDDAVLEVFDTSDPDWILVGLETEYGFAPSNYIDMGDDDDDDDDPLAPSTPAPPSLPARPQSMSQEQQSPVESSSPVSAQGPAAALAGVMQGRAPAAQADSPPPQPPRATPRFEDYHHASDDEPPAPTPALPTRPRQSTEPSYSRHEPEPEEDISAADNYRAPGGFHMYNVNEMVSVMGKKKKMPTTLGINLRTGMILIAPERAQDGPSQEWSADRMTHYSREGKHVFLELVRPSKSIDFHAGAKDTADEIVRGLGEMAGAVRAEGLKEVIMAGSRKSLRKGKILYDFMAQSEDEVTVAAGDEVIILDDSKSEEWWQVRRLRNGNEGVVPSSYIEVTGTASPEPSPESRMSVAEKNRLEEVRLTKEALRASKEEPQQVGPGMSLPERGSSLNNAEQQQSRRQNGRSDGSSSKSKSKPDSAKVRTWTDRSRSFSVDAQFLGLKDDKIHLHKMNGVKIAVPIAKMSRDDIDYVESLTGMTLKNEKPQPDAKKSRPSERPAETDVKTGKPEKPEYDWFQFFLSCEVAVGLCERYAQAFHKESMDESVLPDVDATILRNLGIREGDIIKIMRTLDAKYGRQRNKDGDGGLFSGPGGTLRNNTRKGRPAPAVQTSDVVDASAFTKKDKTGSGDEEPRSPAPASPDPPPASGTKQSSSGGFDDDAWNVKPAAKQQITAAKPQSPPPVAKPNPPSSASLTGSMQELSLLSEPLQPTATASTAQPVSPQAPVSSQIAQSQNTEQGRPGATPSFFSSLPQGGRTSPQAAMRQRPVPPQTSPLQGSLVPPPPQRPLSAPLSAQPSGYPAPGLNPQMTGAIQTQVAPPGQSLNEMTQARYQQQFQQQQQQYTAQMQQPNFTGYPMMQGQGMGAFPTGNQAQFIQPMMTGAPGQSPFADPGRSNSFPALQAQMTGMQSTMSNPQMSYGQPMQGGGINSYLPPALEPQKTGIPPMLPQQTGIGGFNQPGMQQNPQPLQPQPTGPAPPVRFGVAPEPKKILPQATGRKANLSQATPQNPFGF